MIGIAAVALGRRWLRRRLATRHSRKLRRRGKLGLEAFVAEAITHGVSAKVAREAYKLLAECCSDGLWARLDDNPLHDPQLRRDDVVNLHAALLRKTDRCLRTIDMLATYATILQVLHAVEHAQRVSTAPAESAENVVVAANTFLRPVLRQVE